MALQSLCLLAIVSVLLLTPGLDVVSFLSRIEEALIVLAISAAATLWLKLKYKPGQSRLIGAASILFVLAGPVVFAAACTLGLDPPELWKFSFCALLVYLSGSLFYWVSLGDEDDLPRLL